MTSRSTKRETDSARHRRAGAGQVAVVSSKRWALINELDECAGAHAGRGDRPGSVPATSSSSEGYKAAPIPKIEVRRSGAVSQVPLAGEQPNVRAIAADYDIHDGRLPVFALDDVTGIADFIAATVGVTAPTTLAR